MFKKPKLNNQDASFTSNQSGHSFLKKHSWMTSKYGLSKKNKNNFITPKWNNVSLKAKKKINSEHKAPREFIKSTNMKKKSIPQTPDCDKLQSMRWRNEDMLSELEDSGEFLSSTLQAA